MSKSDKSRFSFREGRGSITLANGYRISMRSDINAHCDHDHANSDQYESISFDTEIMIFDPDMKDVTSEIFPDASPDMGYVSADTIVELLYNLKTDPSGYFPSANRCRACLEGHATARCYLKDPPCEKAKKTGSVE